MSKEKGLLALPVTRVQLFRQTYKTQFLLLMQLSLLVSLFALPLFFVEGLQGVHSSVWQETLADGGTPEQIRAYLAEQSIFRLLDIPAYLILSVGLCGGYSLMKAYTFSDGFVFFGTIREGLKKNLGEYLKLTLLFAAVSWLIGFSKNFIVMQNLTWQIPGVIIEAVLQLILLCGYVFGACQIPIYRNSIWRTAKNAMIMAFAKLPKMILVLLGSYLPLRIVWYFQSAAASAVVMVVYMLLGVGHAILVTTLFCQSCFDELVNRTQFPELYRKGLYDPESEDEDW